MSIFQFNIGKNMIIFNSEKNDNCNISGEKSL